MEMLLHAISVSKNDLNAVFQSSNTMFDWSDMFSEAEPICSFSDTSRDCRYIADESDVAKWRKVDSPATCRVSSRRWKLMKVEKQSLTRMFLRPLPKSMQQIDITNFSMPFVRQSIARGRSSLPVPQRCSFVPTTTLELRLHGSMTTKRTSPPRVETDINNGLLRWTRAAGSRVDKATFEVGPLHSSYARYVKFNLEAPVDALAYAVYIFGHCLPDPPGSLYPVHVVPVAFSPHSVSRDFCLNLHSKVRCQSTGRFRFVLRVSLYFVYYGDAPRKVTFRAKGAYKNLEDSLCFGKNCRQNACQVSLVMTFE